MSKYNYIINPRVLSWMIRDCDPDTKLRLEQINKHKPQWVMLVIASIIMILCIVAPFYVDKEAFVLAVIACVAYGSVFPYLIFIITRNIDEDDLEWKAVCDSVNIFYKAFDIDPKIAGQLSYDDTVNRVREVLISLAVRILQSEGDVQIELRNVLREKYNIAQGYLGPDFHDGQEYKYFFDQAQSRYNCIK